MPEQPQTRTTELTNAELDYGLAAYSDAAMSVGKYVLPVSGVLLGAIEAGEGHIESSVILAIGGFALGAFSNFYQYRVTKPKRDLQEAKLQAIKDKINGLPS